MTQVSKPRKASKKAVEEAKIVEDETKVVQLQPVPKVLELFILAHPITEISAALPNGEQVTIALNGVDAVFPVFDDMGKLSEYSQTQKLENPQFFKIRVNA